MSNTSNTILSPFYHRMEGDKLKQITDAYRGSNPSCNVCECLNCALNRANQIQNDIGICIGCTNCIEHLKPFNTDKCPINHYIPI